MDAQQQALSIRQEVTFAPFDFLSRTIAAAARSDGVGAFDALAVDDPGTGRGDFLA